MNFKSKISPAALLLLSFLCVVFPALAREGIQLQVSIDGLEGPLKDNALAALSLRRADIVIETETMLKRLTREGESEIRRALQAYGYYHATIRHELGTSGTTGQNEISGRSQASLQNPSSVLFAGLAQAQGLVRSLAPAIVPGGHQLRYIVIKGAVTDLIEVDIQLSEKLQDWIDLDPVRAKLPLGQPLNHAAYRAQKTALRQQAISHGFLDAKFSRSELRVNLKSRTAKLRWTLNSGPRYRFGDVDIQQNVLDPRLLQAHIPFERGDAFTSDQLLNLQLALTDARYFSRVEVDIDKDNAETTADGDLIVPVIVRTELGKPKRYSGGVGYGTDTGGRLTLRFSNQRLNRRGAQLDGDLRITEEGYEARLNNRWPLLGWRWNPARDSLLLTLKNIDDRPATGRSTERSVGLQLEQAHGRSVRALSLTVEQSRFQLGNQRDSQTLVLPGASYRWQRIDNQRLPSKALSFQFAVTTSSQSLGSDLTFLKLRSQVSWVRRLSPRWRFITETELITTITDGDFSGLPASQREFGGGSGSIRGYGFETLGERDASNQNIGAKHLYRGSVEFEYEITGLFALALFSDSGNASNEFGSNWLTSAGVGLRVRLPFGQLRIDVAQPLEPGPANATGPRLHLTIGPDF